MPSQLTDFGALGFGVKVVANLDRSGGEKLTHLVVDVDGGLDRGW